MASKGADLDKVLQVLGARPVAPPAPTRRVNRDEGVAEGARVACIYFGRKGLIRARDAARRAGKPLSVYVCDLIDRDTGRAAVIPPGTSFS